MKVKETDNIHLASTLEDFFGFVETVLTAANNSPILRIRGAYCMHSIQPTILFVQVYTNLGTSCPELLSTHLPISLMHGA